MIKTIIETASAAMSAQRLRVKTIASNIANAETTQTPEGGPYRRRDVVLRATEIPRESPFQSMLDKASLKGVEVAEVREDTRPPRLVYDPAHPDADPETGNVAMPNINPVTEMVNLLGATNSYKAAAEVVNITKQMAQAVQRLGRRF